MPARATVPGFIVASLRQFKIAGRWAVSGFFTQAAPVWRAYLVSRCLNVLIFDGTAVAKLGLEGHWL
jgi:hypothetical protein